MTSVFSHGVESLLAELQERERELYLVQRFSDTGGVHRISIAVEHPDPEVKAAVEKVAARNIPANSLMKGIIKSAFDDATTSRHALIGYCQPHYNEDRPEVTA